MPDNTSAALAIGMMAAIVLATRLGGYAVASWLVRGPLAQRVLHCLPGCAFAAILAPAVLRGGVMEAAALVVALGVYHATGRMMVSLGLGVGLLVLGAHLFQAAPA